MLPFGPRQNYAQNKQWTENLLVALDFVPKVNTRAVPCQSSPVPPIGRGARPFVGAPQYTLY